MTIYWSDTLRNGVVAAIETTIGTAPVVRIYDGGIPADESTAITTQSNLTSWTLASDWSTQTTGTLTLSGTPLTSTATVTGTGSFYRFFAADGTTVHMQGSLTATGGGGDMTIDNVSITSGQTVRITGWTIAAPH